jgi:hypothetical protein
MTDFIVAHPVISIVIGIAVLIVFIIWAIHNAGKHDRERQRSWQQTQ